MLNLEVFQDHTFSTLTYVKGYSRDDQKLAECITKPTHLDNFVLGYRDELC